MPTGAWWAAIETGRAATPSTGRSSAAPEKGAARADPDCPTCGAPLRIEMAGNCSYCRAKVTSGEFDWVLSRIEQDEVYAG